MGDQENYGLFTQFLTFFVWIAPLTLFLIILIASVFLAQGAEHQKITEDENHKGGGCNKMAKLNDFPRA